PVRDRKPPGPAATSEVHTVNETQKAEFRRLTDTMKSMLCQAALTPGVGIWSWQLRSARLLERRGFLTLGEDDFYSATISLPDAGQEAAALLNAKNGGASVGLAPP